MSRECGINGRVYFVVKTMFEAATKRKRWKAQKKLRWTAPRPKGTERSKGRRKIKNPVIVVTARNKLYLSKEFITLAFLTIKLGQILNKNTCQTICLFVLQIFNGNFITTDMICKNNCQWLNKNLNPQSTLSF